MNYNLQISVKLDGLVLVIEPLVKRRSADHEQLPSNHATMRFSCCGQNARDPAIIWLHLHSLPLNSRLQSIAERRVLMTSSSKQAQFVLTGQCDRKNVALEAPREIRKKNSKKE